MSEIDYPRPQPTSAQAPQFVPLEDIFSAGRRPNLALYLTPDRAVISWQNWLLQVARWRQALQSRPEQRWALYHPNAAEFSACLFALLSLQKTVCLPGSSQPAFVQMLTARVDAFAGDFGASDARFSEAHRPASQNPVPTLSIAPLMPDGEPLLPDSGKQPADAQTVATLNALKNLPLNHRQPLLEIFTSGSSGEPQAIPKSLSQLGAEVTHLHQRWGQHWQADGPLNRGALVVSTVSHQHIYGLLYRVLWPLAAGWCSDTHPCSYLEELATRHLGSVPRLLISSPTHLSRIPDELAAPACTNVCAVFSSGAPLAREASLNTRTHFNTGVREIFGSSETGGIAWRIQDFPRPPHQPAAPEQLAAPGQLEAPGHEAQWQPLPGIELRQNEHNQCLEVRSSHLPDDHWYSTSDRIRFDAPGHFSLLGRADRIVKLEAKRLSLDEMEQQLLHSPLVSQARLLLLNPAATAQRQRTELAAVIALSQQGQERLRRDGKRALGTLLKAHLLPYFERPLLPRKWRYVGQLPVNSQGKLLHQSLLQLFQAPADTETAPATAGLQPTSDSTATMPNTPPPRETHPPAAQRPTLPRVLGQHSSAPDAISLQLQIPADLLYFEGHFATAPILPGVVQVHWAEHYGRETFSPAGEFLRLEVIKFQKVVTPGQQVTLELLYQADTQKIAFVYHSDAGQHASGRIVLGDAT